MIRDGYIYINNIRYVHNTYMDCYGYTIYDEKYINNDENFISANSYLCIKTANGYYFEKEVGGYVGKITYVDKVIKTYLNWDTIIENHHDDLDKRLLRDDYSNLIGNKIYNHKYVLQYNENNGIYIVYYNS